LYNEAIGGSNATVTGGGGSPAWVGLAQGGGIANFNLDPGSPQAVVTVANCTFIANVAQGGHDDRGTSGVYLTGVGEGGGIENGAWAVGQVATLTASNCTFSGNQAVGGGDATGGLVAAAGIGGGVATDTGAVTTLSDCNLDHNLAVGGSGTEVRSAGDGLGGGIANILESTTVVRNCTVAHHRAVGGKGEEGGGGGNGLGGGLYNDGSSSFGVSSLTITGSLITHNDAAGGEGDEDGSAGQGIGGGAYLAAGGSARFDVFTAAHVKRNHASTSNDDVFGVFTACP
jgi:hypothetical protein